MPTADLYDKLSIAILKASPAFGNDDKALDPLREVLAEPRSGGGEQLLLQLIAVNAVIWSLESDIRQGKEGLLGLEEVGRRALAIRDWNNRRVAIKNRIAFLANEPIETKTNHASA